MISEIFGKHIINDDNNSDDKDDHAQKWTNSLRFSFTISLKNPYLQDLQWTYIEACDAKMLSVPMFVLLLDPLLQSLAREHAAGQQQLSMLNMTHPKALKVQCCFSFSIF